MRLIIALAFLLSTATGAIAQGIDFFHGSWEEALEKASKEEKVIFVDAFTTWCGPCKRMAAAVFPDPGVGELYNENFVCMKIDMESPEGMTFMSKYPVSAFPTLYYIDGSGKVVFSTKGAPPVDKFIEMGRMVLGKQDNSQEYAKAYDEGNRDPELVYKYVKALNKADKSSLKVANEYLDSQTDLTTEQNLRFILEAVTEADSRIFDLLIEHKGRITALTSAEEVQQKIENACIASAQKAIEFESEQLLDEAKSKVKKYCPDKAEDIIMGTEMTFYSKTMDVKKYLKVCNTYVKKKAGNNASELYSVLTHIESSFPDDPKALKMAEKLAKKAAQNGGLFKYYYSYASILYKNGKKNEALEMARKSLDLAAQQERSLAEQLIDKIQAG